MQIRLITEITVVIIAVLVSIFTLWLVEGEVKYFFFFFEVALILLLYRIVTNASHSKITFTSQTYIILFLDYFFVIVSLLLFFLNVCNVFVTAKIGLAIVLTLFLPGYVMLRLLNVLPQFFSNLEIFVLSYALSIALTGVISFFLLPYIEDSLIVNAVYVFLSFIPLAKGIFTRRNTVNNKNVQSIHHCQLESVNVLGLIMIVLFFCFVIICVYPQMGGIPGLDIARSFMHNRILSRTPDLSSVGYPWFNLHQITVYALSKPVLTVFQTAFAYVSILIFFSFYVMANVYLKEIDKRLPLVSTVFWFLFSGFGWVYFLQEKLQHLGDVSRLELLFLAGDTTYWDTTYGTGPWLWLWYRPITVGFIIFFALLYLLRRTELPRHVFLVVFSLLVATLGLAHPPELVMFLALLIFLAFFHQKIKLRIHDALLSATLGTIGIMLVYTAFYLRFGTTVSTLLFITVLVTMFASFSTYFITAHKSWSLHITVDGKVVRVLAMSSIILYMGGLLAWLSSTDTFSVKYVDEVYFVPWSLYPVLLGIVGLLALAGFVIVAWEYKTRSAVVFVYLFILAVILGKLVSVVNVGFFYSGYFERRFIPIIFSAASVMAVMTLVKIGKRRVMAVMTLVKIKRRRGVRAAKVKDHKTFFAELSFKKIACASLIGIFVVNGATSTFLSIEFWNRWLYAEYARRSQEEYNAISFMTTLFEENPRSPVFTITDESISDLEFSAAVWAVVYKRLHVWASMYPEVPLTLLYDSEYSPPYIYLHSRDVEILQRTYKDAYLARHMLQYLPEVYINSEATVYRVPLGVPPSLDSDNVLLIPFDDDSDSYFFAYDMLSLGRYDYAVMFDSDSNILEKKVLILPIDAKDIRTFSDYLNWTRTGKKLIVLNTNGYGLFADMISNSSDYEEACRASSIVGVTGKIGLPAEVEVPLFTVKNDIQVLGWYSDGLVEVPFVAQSNVDGADIVYVNVYPLVEGMLGALDSKRALYESLVKSLDVVDLDLPKSGNASRVYNDILAFREAVMRGTINVSSSSLILPPKTMLKTMNITTNSQQILLTDVESVNIRGVNSVVISAQDAKMGFGKGFYTSLTINSSKIIVQGSNIVISANTTNGTTINIEDEPYVELSLKGDNVTLYLSQPNIFASGETLFKETYAYHSLLTRLRTLGQDLYIRGDVEFNLPLSDIHSIATEFTWAGSLERVPPILQWDDWDSIIQAIPWLLMMTIIFAGYVIAKNSWKDHAGEKKFWRGKNDQRS